MNYIMIVALIAFQFVGATFGMQSMANTSIVYTTLYVLEKYVYVHTYNNWNGWILMLIVSVIGWR